MAWPTEAGSIAFIRSRRRAPEAAPVVPRSRIIFPPIGGAFASGFDGLRIYGSGAASDGGAQASEVANLGNYRSSTEWPSLGIFGAMERITIGRASEGNDPGAGALESDGAGNLRWSAPGSITPGPYQFIGDGQTIVLYDGADSSKALRVTLSGAAPAAGVRQIRLTEIYNGGLGLDNVTNAERSAGESEYRCLVLKNLGISACDLRIYLKTLGTTRGSSGVYAAAGAVTVTLDGAIDDWPQSGFVQNYTKNEVIYYSGRSDASPWTLTVPAAGRDVFADVGGGAAGAAADVMYSVPGLRFAKEDPSAQPGGFVQTIANENTAPAGRTWLRPAFESDANVLEINLPPSNQVGLWIQRKIVAAATARARVQNQIVVDHLVA